MQLDFSDKDCGPVKGCSEHGNVLSVFSGVGWGDLLTTLAMVLIH